MNEPRKLDFLPREHTDIIFVVHGGGRITRAVVRVITPPVKLFIKVCSRFVRIAERVRNMTRRVGS
jgi:hypothetical protein